MIPIRDGTEKLTSYEDKRRLLYVEQGGNTLVVTPEGAAKLKAIATDYLKKQKKAHK